MMRNVFLALGLGTASVACAQGLDRRLDAARADRVQFATAARPGICGDGRSYIRVDDDTWVGSWNDATRASACAEGPLRVVVTRAAREILRIEAFVGPVPAAGNGVEDIGRAATADAAAWLATMVRTGEGRVARDAMLPFGVLDSARATPVLQELLLNRELPRDTRRAALTWMVRRRASSDALGDEGLVALLVRLARDGNEHSTLRQSAVGHLARIEPAGVSALITLTAATDEGSWLARQAVEQLGRHGDPRARRAIRAMVGESERPAEVRAAAVQAIGGEYGTTRDVDALVTAWPTLGTDAVRDAALGAMASIGGEGARAFLVRTVRDEGGLTRSRRRAASLLERVGVPVRDIVTLYDVVSDGEVRGQLIDHLAQAGTREAVDKLMRIAKEDTQPTARRRAIAALGRRDDPAVREALKALVGS